MNVGWSNAYCVEGHKINGSGRPLQHDVGISGEKDCASDQGAVLEIKWLTHVDTVAVAQDIWKLALSRSTQTEGQAVRTYLMVGGEKDAFKNTLAKLGKLSMPLRWSPAGRGKNKPRPSTLNLLTASEKTTGLKALQQLLKRGEHCRMPPETWAKVRASMRTRWFRSIGAFRDSKRCTWRCVLWELDHRGFDDDIMDWGADIKLGDLKCRATE